MEKKADRNTAEFLRCLSLECLSLEKNTFIAMSNTGIFPKIVLAPTLKKVIAMAGIDKHDVDGKHFQIYKIHDGAIVRIKRNGQVQLIGTLSLSRTSTSFEI